MKLFDLISNDNFKKSVGISAILLLTSTIDAAIIDTWIVCGQSNAEGYGITESPVSGLAPADTLPGIGRPDLHVTHNNVRFYQMGTELWASGSAGLSSFPNETWHSMLPHEGLCYDWGSGLGNESGRRFGPELSFGYKMQSYLGAEIAIIKQARGSATLASGTTQNGGDGYWNDYDPTDTRNNQYDKLVAVITNAANALPSGDTLRIQGVLWMQGEGDAGNNTMANAYQTNLTEFISELRSSLSSIAASAGTKLIPATSWNETRFFVGKIAGGGTTPRVNTIRSAMDAVAAADANVWTVEAKDGMTFMTSDDWGGSGLHYDTAGQILLGERFHATALGSMIGEFVDPETASSALPVSGGTNWKLTFSDEFNGTSLDSTKWGIDVSTQSRNPRPSQGIADWWWKSENVTINGSGYVELHTTKFDSDTMHCGSISSDGLYEPKYGYLEARIQIADTRKSTHTAFWLQGPNMNNSDPADGTANDGAEVDIFESAWFSDYTKSVVHIDGYDADHKASTKQYSTPNLHNGYRVFGMEWTADSLKIYYDGVLKVTYTGIWVPQVAEWLWLSTGASFGDVGTFTSAPVGPLTSARVDYVRVWQSAPDTTPPTLANTDIVDDQSGGPVEAGTTVTYNLTFNEDINEATLSSADFDNAGDATVSFGAITEISPGVFTIEVTPTTSGTIQLRVPTTAIIEDVAGNALDNDPAILDDTTIAVNGDTTAPTLSSDNIADNWGWNKLAVNTVVIYSLTFSEDIDASTVGSADFFNAGNASITIGAINEIAPGVFTVEVTPTTLGTLQLQIASDATITDVVGLSLATSPVIVDDTTIMAINGTIVGAPITNDDFESGYNTGWNHQQNDGGAAVFSDETTSPYQGAHALKVEVQTLGTNPWSIQTSGPQVSLTVGDEYTLTFWAKSSAAGTNFSTVMQTSAYLIKSYSLGTAWQPYSWTFTALETNPVIRLRFPDLGTVWVDDFRLVESINTPPVVDAGSNQTVSLSSSSWTPALLATSLWLDADDATTITESGGSVSQWADKSGNGNHATQGTPVSQPATGGVINGRNAINFNPGGGTQHLDTNLEQLTTVSIYLVIDPTARGVSGYSAAIGSSAAGYSANSGLFWPIEQYADATERNDVYYTNSLLDKVFCNGIEDSADHNFQPVILSHQGTNLPTANLNYLIGNRSADLQEIFAYKGLIGEIIICPEEHDLGTRQLMEGYLAHKWGVATNLPDGHPHKIEAPTGESVTVTLDATVSDPDNDSLTATWSVSSGPAAVFFDAAAAVDTMARFTATGTYVLELLTDDGADQSSDQVTIRVDAVDGYTAWVSGYDVGAMTEPNDDYDGDGIPNAAENYFGTDPGVANPGLSAGGVTTGEGTTFTFSHPLNDNPASDIAAAYVWSTDLSTYHADGAEANGTTVNFSAGTPANGEVTVTSTITGSESDKIFVRAKVTQGN